MHGMSGFLTAAIQNLPAWSRLFTPRKSGRDNSVDWDEGFERVPTQGVVPFERCDTKHANPDHRPTQAQYERYIWLLQHFRSLGWDNRSLHDASPFRIVDPGFNGILLRSVAEVAELADALGEVEIAKQSRARLEKGISAFDVLWNEEIGQFTCFDRAAGYHVNSKSIAGLLAVFAPLQTQTTDKIASQLRNLSERVNFSVPSHDPADPRFDEKRYWRGPVWLIVNYMITEGLRRAGHADIADKIEQDSLNLIEKAGFAEYYDPFDGTPCGGGQFTWTAAMVIEFLNRPKGTE